MAISYVSQTWVPPTDNENVTAAAVTVANPGSLQAGDVLLLAVCARQANTAVVDITANNAGQTWTGETQIADGSGLITTKLFRCVYNGTWTGTLEVDFNTGASTAVPYCVWLGGFRGVDQATIYDRAVSTQQFTASSLKSQPIIDTTADGAWAFHIWGESDDNPLTAVTNWPGPNGSSGALNNHIGSLGGSDCGLFLIRRQAAGGETFPAVATTTGADTGSGYSFALKPDPNITVTTVGGEALAEGQSTPVNVVYTGTDAAIAVQVDSFPVSLAICAKLFGRYTSATSFYRLDLSWDTVDNRWYYGVYRGTDPMIFHDGGSGIQDANTPAIVYWKLEIIGAVIKVKYSSNGTSWTDGPVSTGGTSYTDATPITGSGSWYEDHADSSFYSFELLGMVVGETSGGEALAQGGTGVGMVHGIATTAGGEAVADGQLSSLTITAIATTAGGEAVADGQATAATVGVNAICTGANADATGQASTASAGSVVTTAGAEAAATGQASTTQAAVTAISVGADCAATGQASTAHAGASATTTGADAAAEGQLSSLLITAIGNTTGGNADAQGQASTGRGSGLAQTAGGEAAAEGGSTTGLTALIVTTLGADAAAEGALTTASGAGVAGATTSGGEAVADGGAAVGRAGQTAVTSGGTGVLEGQAATATGAGTATTSGGDAAAEGKLTSVTAGGGAVGATAGGEAVAEGSSSAGRAFSSVSTLAGEATASGALVTATALQGGATSGGTGTAEGAETAASAGSVAQTQGAQAEAQGSTQTGRADATAATLGAEALVDGGNTAALLIQSVFGYTLGAEALAEGAPIRPGERFYHALRGASSIGTRRTGSATVTRRGGG